MEAKNEFESEFEQYKAQYEKLKAKQDGEWKLKYDELKAEHAALKAKSKRLADIVEKAIDHFTILNSILSEFNHELSVSPKWVIEGQQALAEWKERKV